MVVEGIDFAFVLWCILFGAAGQFLHAFIGLYKLYMDDSRDTKTNLRWKRFFISLMMGAAIGGLCTLIFNDPLSKTDVMSILACGYAGVDFVEGFMERRSSSIQ